MTGLPDLVMSSAFRRYLRDLRATDYLDLEPARNQGLAHPYPGPRY